MNRDDLLKMIEAQPFDTDVQVDVGGFYIDVNAVRFDRKRHSIVVELFAEDAEDAMRSFLRTGPAPPRSGDPL